MDSIFSYNHAIFNAVTFNDMITVKICFFFFTFMSSIWNNLPSNKISSFCFLPSI